MRDGEMKTTTGAEHFLSLHTCSPSWVSDPQGRVSGAHFLYLVTHVTKTYGQPVKVKDNRHLRNHSSRGSRPPCMPWTPVHCLKHLWTPSHKIKCTGSKRGQLYCNTAVKVVYQQIVTQGLPGTVFYNQGWRGGVWEGPSP